jgi:hypothetical protein
MITSVTVHYKNIDNPDDEGVEILFSRQGQPTRVLKYTHTPEWVKALLKFETSASVEGKLANGDDKKLLE